jgi:hypothetical protein
LCTKISWREKTDSWIKYIVLLYYSGLRALIFYVNEAIVGIFSRPDRRAFLKRATLKAAEYLRGGVHKKILEGIQ